MNRNIYRWIALVYLVPLALMHLVENTAATGVQAESEQ